MLSLTSGVELVFVVCLEVALNITMVIDHLLEERRIRIGRNGVKKPRTRTSDKHDRRVYVILRKDHLSTSRSQRQSEAAPSLRLRSLVNSVLSFASKCTLNHLYKSQENATMRVPSMLLMPFVALFGLVSARSATGDRVLVVLESAATKDDYSQFWDSLQRTQIPYECHDILTTK